MFKFYNVIADHESFEQIVREHWRGFRSQNLLLDIWRKCKQLKKPLKALNTQYFRNTTEKVQLIRTEL